MRLLRLRLEVLVEELEHQGPQIALLGLQMKAVRSDGPCPGQVNFRWQQQPQEKPMRTFRLPTVLVILSSCLVLTVSETPAQKPVPKRLAVPAGFVADYDIKYVPNGDAAQELDI